MKSKTLPVISTYLHRLIHPKPCHPPTTRWNYSSKFCLTLLQAHVHSIFIFHILKLRVLISSCVSLLQLTIKLYKFTWPQIRFYIPQVKMEIPNITKVNPYIHKNCKTRVTATSRKNFSETRLKSWCQEDTSLTTEIQFSCFWDWKTGKEKKRCHSLKGKNHSSPLMIVRGQRKFKRPLPIREIKGNKGIPWCFYHFLLLLHLAPERKKHY